MKGSLSKLWRGWKEIAAYIADFQARLVLTVFYFTVAAPFGLLARVVVDPLGLRHRPATSGWTKRPLLDSSLTAARRQF